MFKEMWGYSCRAEECRAQKLAEVDSPPLLLTLLFYKLPSDLFKEEDHCEVKRKRTMKGTEGRSIIPH